MVLGPNKTERKLVSIPPEPDLGKGRVLNIRPSHHNDLTDLSILVNTALMLLITVVNALSYTQLVHRHAT